MPEFDAETQNLDKRHFPWKLALSLYGLSNVLTLLFLKAYFWDDWFIYYTKTATETKDALRQVGHWPIHSIFQVDLLTRQPSLFRVIAVLCFFFAGWYLFQILGTIKTLSSDQARLITILFLILPINSARVSMSVFVYSYSLLLFYFAWYLLVTKQSRFIWLLSIPLFLMSFSTVALLAFFVVPCVHLLYLKLSEHPDKRRIAYVTSALFASLAPLYWLVDRRYNPPLGAYLTMYTPQKLGVFRALILLFICAVMIYWLVRSRNHPNFEFKRFAIIVSGITIIVVGASPYIVGGHLVDISDWMIAFVPRSSDWDSRHQLLLGLGIAVTIAGIVGPINSTFKRQCIVALFALCVVWNVTYMHSYFLDSLKQDQIVEAFERSSDLNESKIIMIDDTTDRYNARGRFVRSYEWEGMLTKAIGENSRSVISGKTYIDCSDPLIPDTLVTITARNGRIESTLTRDLGIEIFVASIHPCG